MSVPAPQTPQYRYTLFFGPEVGETLSHISYCVFNIKKRSWKGGIQIVVEIAHDQISRSRQVLNYEEWLTSVLTSVPEEEQPDYFNHGYDLLTQYLCQMKLQLALQSGLRQETSCISSQSFVDELDQTLEQAIEEIKHHILSELDVREVS